MTNDFMEDLLAKNELKHYGVLGMKWGVRKDRATYSRKSARRQLELAKADQKWAHEIYSREGYIKQNNAMADRMNGPNGLIAKFNKDPRWKGLDLTDPKNAKVAELYRQGYIDLFRNCIEDVAKSLYGESPSGNYTTRVNWDEGKINVVPTSDSKIKHADSSKKIQFELEIDEKGKVVSIRKESLTHSDILNLGEDALAHYGILGMKWGVRRPVGKDGRVTNRVSSDHAETRKLTPRSQRSLSNQELRRINERLQLERTNSDLQSRGALNKIKKGTSAAAIILGIGTTITTAYNFSQSPAGQRAKTILMEILKNKSKVGA